MIFENEEINDSENWIWRVTWFNGTGYGVTYGENRFALVRTDDGVHYSLIRHLDEITGFPGEATIRFTPDGTMYMMIRQEKEDKYFGIAVEELKRNVLLEWVKYLEKQALTFNQISHIPWWVWLIFS